MRSGAHAIAPPARNQNPMSDAGATGEGIRPPSTRPARTPGEGRGPQSMIVFDTETLTDHTQALTLGCARYYRRSAGPRRWTCLQEILFYADDLPETDPDGFAVLQRYAASTAAAVERGEENAITVLSCAQFVERVIFVAGWQAKARIVGFNLPFDLSRLAVGVTEGRGRNRGGFSLILTKGNAEKGYVERRQRPRIQIKHLNAHRSQISFSSALGQAEKWLGDFVDLRTLAFALSGLGYNLDSACEAFSVVGKSDPGEHGHITPDYIDYCRQDVAATAELYIAAERALLDLGLPLTPPYAFSPASLSKATLHGLGVEPLLRRMPDTAPQVLGRAMSAFYGGRAECRIRRTPVPVRLVDFTSTYPTLFALMGLWQHITAASIDFQSGADATTRTQAALDAFALDDGFDPELWPTLVGYARIRPDGANVLPVRAKYDHHSPLFGIGLNPLTADQDLWYALPDLYASKLLSGHTPHLLDVMLLTPTGTTEGLTPLRLPGGRTLDPATEDPFRVMTEERQRIRRDPTLTDAVKERRQLYLKITANAGAYGIWAEYNREELVPGKTKAQVMIYGADDEPFLNKAGAPEHPGIYCYPPLAAVITAAARFALALLERCVTDAGGTWAMCDTDSMGIVAIHDGGLIHCKGGPHQLDGHDAILALSYDQVDEIRGRFEALNPYDRGAVPGTILKAEVDAWCYAVAAKRYALFRLDETGQVSLVPAKEHQPCSHGLGHLLNPSDPDGAPDGPGWIVQLWEHELGRRITPHLPADEPDWYAAPTLARLTVTSPGLLNPFAKMNAGKPYREQVKPFNFMLFAPGAQPPAAHQQEKMRLFARYARARDWGRLRWHNLHTSGADYRITTHPATAGAALVTTHRDNVRRYLTHPETKSTAADGTQCQRNTTGLLRRRPVQAATCVHIGKEANRLDERESGQLDERDLDDAQTVYDSKGHLIR